MVVIYTVGVISRDGGGGVQRQVGVEQTAGDTPRKGSGVRGTPEAISEHVCAFVLMAAVGSRDVGTGVRDTHLQDGGFIVRTGQ